MSYPSKIRALSLNNPSPNRRTTVACYTIRMAKKTTEQKIDALTTIVEKGFAAVAADIADIKRDMATKEQGIAIQTQVNSIETDIRSMKQSKLEVRVGDLEEKVFGASRH